MAVTPVVGDLLVIFVSLSSNVATLTVTDDNGQDGIYTRVASALWGTSLNNSAVFVRDSLLRNTDVTTVTVASGANDAGSVVAVAVSGMLRTGLSAVRSFGALADQAGGTTPTPVLNQSALTGNMTLTAVASSDTTSDPNASWTERADTSQITPTTCLEVATRNSGFTGTSVAYASAQTGTYACFVIELDTSAALLPQQQSVLESYFKTGDQPDEVQFREFIGTMYYLFQQAQNQANLAADDAVIAASLVPLALCSAHYASAVGPDLTYTIDSSYNITTVDIPNAIPFVIKVNFNQPMPSVGYIVAITMTALDQAQEVRITEKNIAYCKFTLGPGSGLRNVGQAFDMIVFHV